MNTQPVFCQQVEEYNTYLQEWMHRAGAELNQDCADDSYCLQWSFNYSNQHGYVPWWGWQVEEPQQVEETTSIEIDVE